jgi:hypothetical protein
MRCRGGVADSYFVDAVCERFSNPPRSQPTQTVIPLWKVIAGNPAPA